MQGTAAEWALCWMAALRRRLLAIEGRPHLVLFLHDEVMVRSPAAVADDVAARVGPPAVLGVITSTRFGYRRPTASR